MHPHFRRQQTYRHNEVCDWQSSAGEARQQGHALLRLLRRLSQLPFTVAVFASDLKQVGDVRRLEGRQIEIDGEIKSYDGRAEIILSRSSQLRGDAAHIPPLPKDYDVERHGKYSAGTFRYPKQAKSASRKKQSPPVSLQEPSLPESPTD